MRLLVRDIYFFKGLDKIREDYMDLLDLIPGKRVFGEQFQKVSTAILCAINPENKPPLEWFSSLKMRSKQEVLDLIKGEAKSKYYLLYTGRTSVIGDDYMLFCVSDAESVLDFIESCFIEERGEGLDVVISDESYKNLIIGNHDGLLLQV